MVFMSLSARRAASILVSSACIFAWAATGFAQETIAESATMGPTGQTSGWSITQTNWLAFRFSTTAEIRITTVGGHAVASTTGFGRFIGIYAEHNTNEGGSLRRDFAVFDTGDITVPSSSAEVRVDVSADDWILPAGDWAIVFGTTMHPFTMTSNNAEVDSPIYVRGTGGIYGWWAAPTTGLNARLFVEGVPQGCGNNLPDPGEQCDTGGQTAACDDDCTFVSCGDDNLNEAAGETCDDGNSSNTDACPNTCKVAVCGDGYTRTGVEQCDNGAANSDTTPNACRTNCLAAACGDGVVDGGETCDDGNSSNNDACLNTCVAAFCRDGFIRTGVEECDDNDNSNTNGCLNSCVVATCRDGYVRTGYEACDDGNNSNADACLNSCTVATCGDGHLRTGVESCDDANNSNTDGCLNSCNIAWCGDGFVRAGVEECDNGAANSNTTPNACRTPLCENPSCGDGITDSGEECDDGNVNNNDNCTTLCRSPFCGDGIRQNDEECDDGDDSNFNDCTNDCFVSLCGDGFVNAGRGEECDDGNDNDNDHCIACQLPPCGNGRLDPGEQCDDGNASNRDDCLNTCRLASCGDGIVNGDDECDDGNQRDGDSCSAECRLPEGGSTPRIGESASGGCQTSVGRGAPGWPLSLITLGFVVTAFRMGRRRRLRA